MYVCVCMRMEENKCVCVCVCELTIEGVYCVRVGTVACMWRTHVFVCM